MNWRSKAEPLVSVGRSVLRPLKRGGQRLYWRHAGNPRLYARFQLPMMLNARGLLGTGAEIGVLEGVYSDWLLATWHGRLLISIDPWLCWGAAYRDRNNRDQAAMDQCYEQARRVLQRHGARSQIWRMTSREAAGKVADDTLDFVYIDAQHHEAAVLEDLRLWYPKVRSGGVFSGHDYLDGNLPIGDFGVKTAVTKFAGEHHLRVNVTWAAEYPTWYSFKP